MFDVISCLVSRVSGTPCAFLLNVCGFGMIGSGLQAFGRFGEAVGGVLCRQQGCRGDFVRALPNHNGV